MQAGLEMFAETCHAACLSLRVAAGAQPWALWAGAVRAY